MFSGSGLAWAVGLAGLIIGILFIRLGLLQQDEGADDPNWNSWPWWYRVGFGVVIGFVGVSILVTAVTGPGD